MIWEKTAYGGNIHYAPDPWWNIWFYNGPLDLDNMKLVKMGFWIQSYNGVDPGDLSYVINWSNNLWVKDQDFPYRNRRSYSLLDHL